MPQKSVNTVMYLQHASQMGTLKLDEVIQCYSQQTGQHDGMG